MTTRRSSRAARDGVPLRGATGRKLPARRRWNNPDAAGTFDAYAANVNAWATVTEMRDMLASGGPEDPCRGPAAHPLGSCPVTDLRARRERGEDILLACAQVLSGLQVRLMYRAAGHPSARWHARAIVELALAGLDQPGVL